MDELTRKRLDRVEVSTGITPLELLELTIDDIKRGEINPDGLVIIHFRRPKDEPWECGTLRANCPRDQELAQLKLAEDRCIRAWREG